MSDPPARLSAVLADRYVVERELGQGGMATVYLAEDLKHHRKVALKVLRAELAATLGPKRFLREIETTAQLAHPHILPLLDSGAADGTLFYVMPYVEGESLRGRLEREKQLPLDDALQITREVADALSYAHSRGVIHRDIKPENILLQGAHAVVADFGIARAVSAAGRQRLTETGLVIGTPAYMSPEQAAGEKDVDGRSDLYSLGCVLYEMLSGETPYTGPTAQAILAKKLGEPLPRISVVREAVSPGVEAALNKALARTPADRFGTASEFAGALAHPETIPAPVTTPSGRWRRQPARLAAALVVIGVATVTAVLAIRGVARPLSRVATDVTPVTSEPGVEFQPAISPDGKEVAYVAGAIGAPQLMIRSTANVAGGDVRLADPSFQSEWYPSWSPEGEFVRFLGCRATGCDWYEIGRMGGALRALALPPGAESPAWASDGRVAFVIAETIFVSSPASSQRRPVAVQRTGTATDIHSLTWSVDGKSIAYVVGNSDWRTSGNLNPSSIWIVAADGGEPRSVTSSDNLNTSPTWLDAHHLLFVSNRDGPTGMYVLDVGAGGTRAAARAIPGVSDPHSISYASAARSLVYAKFELRQNVRAYPLGRPGSISIRLGVPVTNGSQVIEATDVSPDDRWLAYNGNARGNSDIYKKSLSGDPAVPLTDTPYDEYAPRWSPDGRELAYQAMIGTNSSRIMVMSPEGGSPTAVTRPRTNTWDNFPVWSRSGLAIAFGRYDGVRLNPWLVVRDTVGGQWHEPVRLSGHNCMPADWAPDGSGALCASYPSGSMLTLLPVHGPTVWTRDLAATSQLTLDARAYALPKYSRDGRTIFVVGTHQDGRRGVWAIPVTAGQARLVVASDDPAVTAQAHISVSRDRIYLTVGQYESDIWRAKLSW